MRRRHVRGAKALPRRAHPLERVDVDPATVHRDRNQRRARGAERGVRTRVSRLLDCDAIAPLEQHRRAEAQRGLRPGYDQHLLGLAPDGSCGAQMLGDGCAQHADACRITVRHVGRRQLARMSRDEACPLRVRELVERGEADPKGAKPALVACARRVRPDTARCCGARHALRRRGRAECVVWQRGRDERSRADTPFQIALVQQLLVGGEHRQTRHTELAREHPGGRHAFAGPQQPREDGSAQTVIDLLVQGRPIASLDGQQGEQLRAGGGSHDCG